VITPLAAFPNQATLGAALANLQYLLVIDLLAN